MVENEIRRGAFYMRPRKFISPQAGTGGYGIRPYVFCGDGEGHVFPCCVCRGDHWSPVNLPPQRIFRDSFLVRQAGTGEQCSPLQMFFGSLSPKYSCPPHVSLPPPPAGGAPSQRGPRESGALRGVFSLWPKTKSVGAHSICARGSLSYSKRARADMESAPTFLKRQSTSRHGA